MDSILAGQRRIFRNVSTVTLPSDIYKWQKHVKEDNMVDYKQQFPRLLLRLILRYGESPT